MLFEKVTPGYILKHFCFAQSLPSFYLLFTYFRGTLNRNRYRYKSTSYFQLRNVQAIDVERHVARVAAKARPADAQAARADPVRGALVLASQLRSQRLLRPPRPAVALLALLRPHARSARRVERHVAREQAVVPSHRDDLPSQLACGGRVGRLWCVVCLWCVRQAGVCRRVRGQLVPPRGACSSPHPSR